MNANIIFGLLLINISIFLIVFGDKGMGGNSSLLVKFVSIGKGRAKLVKWTISVFLFLFGVTLILNANLEYQEIFYGMGLLFWVGSASCLSIIGLRNSASLYSQSMASELPPADMKLAKMSGILFVLGILAFIVGNL